MTSLAELRARFLAAQLRGDRRDAARVVLVEGLAAGVPVEDLHEHVLQSAQREIGRLWQENQVTIAQEHMATAIAGLVLTQLFDRVEAKPRNGRTVMIACVQGELHEFPARMVADALEIAGFGVQYVGADVPVDGLLSLIAARTPDLVALSATMSFHVPSLKRTVKAIRERFGRKVAIAVGGGALTWTPALAAELDVDIAAMTVAELIAEASKLVEKK